MYRNDVFPVSSQVKYERYISLTSLVCWFARGKQEKFRILVRSPTFSDEYQKLGTDINTSIRERAHRLAIVCNR